MQTWLSKRKQKEREKPMDGFMDCTNLKANMVLIHAVCVRSKAPTPCHSEEDVYLEKLTLTGTVEVLSVEVLLGQESLAMLRVDPTVTVPCRAWALAACEQRVRASWSSRLGQGG